MKRPGNSSRQVGGVLALGIGAGAIWISGCGDKGETPAPQAQPAAATQPADSTTATPPAQSTPVVSTSVRDPRTNWIGNVPYDVFFDRPLDVYRDSTPVGSQPPDTGTAPAEMPAETVTSNAATPDTTATPEPAGTESAAGETDWASLAAIDVLNEEVKERRTRLTANLQTVATYNGNTELVVTDANILASIAAVIERHSGELNWKPKAGHVRGLAYDMYLSAGNSGRGPFENTKEPFEKVVTILDGGPVEGEADEAVLSDVGDRGCIMKRFEESFGWLRSDINTETRLKEDKDRVIREASVLATLATVIGDPNYDNATADDYKMFLQQFIDGCQGMVSAANSGNFAEYEAGRNMVDGSCNPCHTKYRTNDDGF